MPEGSLVVQPFKWITLQKLAEIVGGHYTGSDITRFFEGAGFPEFRHDGSTKWLFIYETLKTIQDSENGSYKIIGIIEEFCDPKALIDDVVVDSIRFALEPCGLSITSTGKVTSKTKLPEAIDSIELIALRFHPVVQELKKRRSGHEPFTISDEYDVQYLFHAMLYLFFEDIRPEEWTPSYAGGQSRVDFLLKREQTVVEIKKTRKGLNTREVGNQLIEDIHRYHTLQNCHYLIAFVYDPDGYISNPRGFEADLSKPVNNLQVKVIIAPR